VQAPRDSDRVRRPGRGAEQDEQGHRPRGGMEGAAPPAHGLVRPHLIGLPVYKMTGSGNDFVMVDARVSTPADWTPEDMQAVCARGTGIGADGIVFVGPGSHAGAARMIYYNADGSHAAMCGNAALCSTTLAVHLGVGTPDGMDLETDAGTYKSRAVGTGRAELNLAAVERPAAVAGPAPGGCGPMSAGSKARPWRVAPVPWAQAARFRSGAWAGYQSISRAAAAGCLVCAPHKPTAGVATTTSGWLAREEWSSEVSLL